MKLYCLKIQGPFSIDCRGRGSHAAPHRIPRAQGNSKGEARGRSKHKNNSKRGVRNMEERNVDMRGDISKQSLYRDKVLNKA